MEKKEIVDGKDVALMVDLFYDLVRKDKLIGPIFNDVIKVNWETHLPKMYTFWESLLFDENIYKGNPLAVHQEINKNHPLKPEHFKRWITLFNKSIETNFEGALVEKAKQRALSILTVMEIKIYHKS